MSVKSTTAIKCDITDCEESIELPSGGVREFKKAVRESGWIVNRDQTAIGPKHNAKVEETELEPPAEPEPPAAPSTPAAKK